MVPASVYFNHIYGLAKICIFWREIINLRWEVDMRFHRSQSNQNRKPGLISRTTGLFLLLIILALPLLATPGLVPSVSADTTGEENTPPSLGYYFSREFLQQNQGYFYLAFERFPDASEKTEDAFGLRAEWNQLRGKAGLTISVQWIKYTEQGECFFNESLECDTNTSSLFYFFPKFKLGTRFFRVIGGVAFSYGNLLSFESNEPGILILPGGSISLGLIDYLYASVSFLNDHLDAMTSFSAVLQHPTKFFRIEMGVSKIEENWYNMLKTEFPLPGPFMGTIQGRWASKKITILRLGLGYRWK